MLHLPPDKNKLLLECDIQSVKIHTAEYQITTELSNILDQICNNNDDGRRAFCAIQSRWLGPNNVNATSSEAELALQMWTHDGEKKA